MLRQDISGRAALRAAAAPLALVISFMAQGAQAQNAAGAASAAVSPEADEVVVVRGTPIMGSQRAAIAIQRSAGNVMSVIAADTVGQFPDQNSAAALARVPAVAVQRDQGQERYLQIRGAPNRWTSVSIDGISIIGSDEGGTQRAFRFDAVPSVILSQLEVNKSLTADMSAESIVARVNLRTFSPFDRRGLAGALDLGSGDMRLGGGGQRQIAGRVSWSGDNWGFIAAASHYLREQVTDNREAAYGADGRPTTIDVRSYQVDRHSDGAILGVEYRSDADSRVFAKTIYTEFGDAERRLQYVFQIGNALSGTRTAEAGDLIGVPVRGTFNDGDYDNWNRITTIGADFSLAGWDVTWRANRTETENTTNLPLVLSQQASSAQRIALRYDRSDPRFPILSMARLAAGATPGTFVRGADIVGPDAAMFTLNLLLPLESGVETDAVTWKIDAGRNLDFAGREVELLTGLAWERRVVNGSILSGSAPAVVMTALFPTVGRSFNYADYVTGVPWATNFPSGLSFEVVDNERMRRDIESGLAALQAAGRYNPALNTSPTDKFGIVETITSGYVSATAGFGSLQLIGGLRLESSEQTVNGFLRIGTGATARIVPLGVTSDDTTLFPSLNARWEFGEDLILRGAVHTGIARPSFGSIRSGASVSDLTLTIQGGNPNLEPEKTLGFDLSAERYLDNAGVISVGAFVRLVDNVLFDASAPVTDDTYDTPDLDRTGYTFTATRNGDRGQLFGIEFNWQQQFSFLPAPFDGLGFQGNLTLLDGEFETGDGRTERFPGTSDTIINASVFYERDGLSARLSWQWRDDWIDTLNSLGSGEFRQGYQNLDLSVRYAVNDTVSVYLDANNLTDEIYLAYEGTPASPSEVEQIGRRWLAGIRVSF